MDDLTLDQWRAAFASDSVGSSPELISAMLTSYAEDLRVYLLMLREREQRNGGTPLQRRIAEHWQSFYQSELDWVSTLRHSLER